MVQPFRPEETKVLPFHIGWIRAYDCTARIIGDNVLDACLLKVFLGRWVAGFTSG